VESVAAFRVDALQSAGPAAVGVADDDGVVEDVLGLAEEVPGSVVSCVCGWLGPQAVSSSAVAAAAVVMANPCDKSCELMALPLWLV
jgi:pyruvoyl-dependent arginine decarboxylase (PvlArgDC)